MIYVISDIHGYTNRFESILKQINLQEDDTLYIIGDVIDRNPDGIFLLQRIMKSGNMKMIIGNHELMMLDALADIDLDEDMPSYAIDTLMSWYDNGGRITHKFWKFLRKPEQHEIRNYLKSLPFEISIEVNGKQYLLVHGRPLEHNSEKTEYENLSDSVWGRYEMDESGPDDTTVIFGHTPTIYYHPGESQLTIYYGDHLIGIDCGCAFAEGRLACLRLDDMKEFYSEVDNICLMRTRL